VANKQNADLTMTGLLDFEGGRVYLAFDQSQSTYSGSTIHVNGSVTGQAGITIGASGTTLNMQGYNNGTVFAAAEVIFAGTSNNPGISGTFASNIGPNVTFTPSLTGATKNTYHLQKNGGGLAPLAAGPAGGRASAFLRASTAVEPVSPPVSPVPDEAFEALGNSRGALAGLLGH
jgi:hypothetical protein